MATTIKKKGAPEFDWRTIKTDWIAKNLRVGQKPFTLKQVAKKWNVAYGTVKNKAYRYGWRGQLTESISDRDKRSLKEVRDRAMWDETEVRLRQAGMARVATAKAVEALKYIKASDLSPNEAFRLLKLGLEQERRALGIPNVMPPEHQPPPEDKYGNESVEDRMARVRKYRDLADRLRKFVSDREKDDHAKAAASS